MKSWYDQFNEAVAAGEREFGLLDAHQTLKHNLARRCEELLIEERQAWPAQEQAELWVEGDQN